MPEPNKIIKLIDHNNDGRSWSVEEMLRDCLENKDFDRYNKAVVLFLDTHDGDYSTSFAQAGLSRSDMVSLLNVMALIFTRKLTEGKEL